MLPVLPPPQGGLFHPVPLSSVSPYILSKASIFSFLSRLSPPLLPVCGGYGMVPIFHRRVGDAWVLCRALDKVDDWTGPSPWEPCRDGLLEAERD